MTDKEISQVIDNLLHTNLYVLNKGTDENPDYVVGGTENTKNSIIRLIEFIKETKKETNK
jgi:hypothetical protein